MEKKFDVVIVGTGAAGLFCALSLPQDKKILCISKDALDGSDSFLAQGGICMLRDDNDYDSYFEDTMRAGHYENRKESVEIMIKSSQQIIHDLEDYGVEFEKKDIVRHQLVQRIVEAYERFQEENKLYNAEHREGRDDYKPQDGQS